MNTRDNLINSLNNSRIYQEFERAFSDTTGLPAALRPVESWQLPHHGRRKENLLPNPNLRVSEIAYEVGFQSLTHFNRMFKRILGLSPTEYRQQLPSASYSP